MTAISRTPNNPNFLQPNKFILTFGRTPNVTYFCQSLGVPGLSLSEVPVNNPFLDVYSPGEKAIYDLLNVTFMVDEELQSWKDMYNWFTSIASPDGFEGRDHPRELQQNKHFSNATLTILSALNNPVLRIEFNNCFPITMNGIDFDVKKSAEDIITCRASFRYESYKYLTQ